MYKAVISFLEVGKDKMVHWSVRGRDIFLGIFLLVGGFFMLCSGIVFLLTENTDAGAVFGICGLTALVLYGIARRKKRYGKYSLNIAAAVFSLSTLALPCVGESVFGGIHCVIYPLIIGMIFGARRGGIISFAFLAVYFACGLLLQNNDLFFSAAVFLAGIVVLFATGAILAVSEDLASAGEDKLTDIRKEAEIKNEFISQLSYQIRTPLNNIVVIGNLLNETQLNRRQKDWMETILASANNLVTVVNMIGSRVASTGIADTKAANVAFDLQTVMNNTIQVFVGQSDDYNIALKQIDAPEPYMLEGDPIQIKQIFLTLVDAIVKSKNAEKINIIISCRVTQETERLYDAVFEIKVSDRLDVRPEADKTNPGMLNYSISSNLIAATGHQLTATYREPYTIFNFTLSFKKALAVPKEKNSEMPETAFRESAGDIFAKKTTVELKDADILLVEDNLINQRIVILSIQKHIKNIDVAGNGREALEKFAGKKYDLILMDIQMPVMDGLQATQKIRETEKENNAVPTPIIAITANALAGDREHCLASGMDEYIAKPFQVTELMEKMKHLLASGSSRFH